MAGDVMVGDIETLPDAAVPAGSTAFANPKSSTFTVPSSRTLMLAGFRIAVDDALLVSGFKRVGDLLRDGQGDVDREARFLHLAARPHPRGLSRLAPALRRAHGALSVSMGARRVVDGAADVFIERDAVDQFHHEGRRVAALLDTVDVRDVRVVECREDFRFAPEPCQPIRVGGDAFWQDLDGDRPFEVGVGGAVDLAHSAHANLRGDFVRAETGAGRQGHRDVGL